MRPPLRGPHPLEESASPTGREEKARSMSELAIEARGLSRDFKTVRAVDGLTLEVPSGIVFGFLGPNGAGKTTTIHLLLGLLEPTDGYAEVLGDDIRGGDRVRERTGALLEFN